MKDIIHWEVVKEVPDLNDPCYINEDDEFDDCDIDTAKILMEQGLSLEYIGKINDAEIGYIFFDNNKYVLLWYLNGKNYRSDNEYYFVELKDDFDYLKKRAENYLQDWLDKAKLAFNSVEKEDNQRKR